MRNLFLRNESLLQILRPGEICQSLLVVPLLIPSDRTETIEIRPIRLKLNCLTAVGDCTFKVALTNPNKSSVSKGASITGVKFNCLAVVGNCLVIFLKFRTRQRLDQYRNALAFDQVR